MRSVSGSGSGADGRRLSWGGGRRRLAGPVLIGLFLLTISACNATGSEPGGDVARPDDRGSTPPGSVTDDQPHGELLVFAAASLHDVFDTLTASFARAYPQVTVTMHVAGSSTLATQILEGAPADVFAAADELSMDRVAAAGRVDRRQPLARNLLQIAVERGNPLQINGLDDLARQEVVFVQAASPVPAGRLAAQLLSTNRVDARPASYESDVRGALGRVALGEADAAIVYRSDLVSAPHTVEPVVIPDERNVSTAYPIATLRESANPSAARAWVEHVRGPAGRAALVDAGFLLP